MGTCCLRLYGLSWDEGYLFHPDERQILIVTERLTFPWPPNMDLLLSRESPWNPKFFAYGSLPLYLLRLTSNLIVGGQAGYETTYLVGRILSALFDVGTILLIYALGCELYERRIGLLAAALVALTVLHIQLAHFYAVDTLLALTVVGTVLLAVRLAKRPTLRHVLPLGALWGAALATKVSAAPLGIAIAAAWGWELLDPSQDDAAAQGSAGRRTLRALGGLVLTGLVALAVFLFCEPYALVDALRFGRDIVQESYMARGKADIPYTRQFIGTPAYLYPLWQMVVWSMGIPLGILGVIGALLALGQWVRLVLREQWRRAGELLPPLTWVVVYFAVVGSFRAKFLRYMLPIIPFLCLWGAWALVRFLDRGRGQSLVKAGAITALALVLVGTGAYALAYMNVYRQEHPWLQTTDWLCEHLRPGSQILIEHWDDPLPLVQGRGRRGCHQALRFVVFPAYDPDSPEKLAFLLDALERSDYIVLSTNRLYNTIPRLPKRYPISSRYYELLMGERLGYELVYYVAVYPELGGIRLVNDTFSDPDLPIPRLLAENEAKHISLNLGRADESYTVYDHPMPMVFAKKRQLSRQELEALFAKTGGQAP